MTSINTNVTALAALRTLQQTTNDLADTQGRIESGFKVNGAADGPSTFVIAQGLRGDVQSLSAVQEGIGFGQAALTTASAGAEEISNRLNDLREQFTSARNEGLPTAPLQEEADSIISQIDAIVSASTFSGINLLDGNQDLNVLSGVNGESVQVASTDVTSSGLGLNGLNLRTTDAVTRVTFDGAAATNALEFADGDTFQLERANGELVTFEFDSGGGVTAGNIAVAQNADENISIDNLVAAINNVAGLSASQRDGDATAAASFIDIQDGLGPITAVNTGGAGAFTAQTSSGALGFAADVTFNGNNALLSDGVQFSITKADGTVLNYELDELTGGTGSGVTNGFTNIDIDVDDDDTGGVNTPDTAAIVDAIGAAIAGDNLEVTLAEEDTTAGTFTLRFRDTTGTAGTNRISDVQVSNTTAGTTVDPVVQRDPNREIASTFAEAQIEQAAATLDTVLSALGTADNRLESQASFTQLLSDKIQEGVGILVDADLAAESAQLNALQTKQQLATQSLSIANQAPNQLLSLFR